MNVIKFGGEGRGVCLIIARKERKCGLNVPFQHFFEELGKENEGEYEVTNGVNLGEIYRRLLLGLVWSGTRMVCANFLDQTVA